MLKLKHFSIVLLTAVISILASNVYALHLDANINLSEAVKRGLHVEYSLYFPNGEHYEMKNKTPPPDDWVKNFNDACANRDPIYLYIAVSYMNSRGKHFSSSQQSSYCTNKHIVLDISDENCSLY